MQSSDLDANVGAPLLAASQQVPPDPSLSSHTTDLHASDTDSHRVSNPGSKIPMLGVSEYLFPQCCLLIDCLQLEKNKFPGNELGHCAV